MSPRLELEPYKAWLEINTGNDGLYHVDEDEVNRFIVDGVPALIAEIEHLRQVVGSLAPWALAAWVDARR